MTPPKKPAGHGISTRATIVRVLDGDTFECSWFGRKVKIRLMDCWVEDGSKSDKKAAKYLSQFISHPVIVWIPTDEATSVFDLITFDRILAWVWPKFDDESVNETLVRLGFATAEKPK